MNRFIRRSLDKYKPFFSLLKKATDFLWIEESEVALANLKKYFTTTLVLLNPIPGDESTLR